ncbi:MAG: acyl carrier protein [Pirellula sp.]|jgi:acyl carrier protein|nr:acyl carrier protein [Pirellula sp.]
MDNSSQLAGLEAAESKIIEYLKKIVGGAPKPDDSLAVLGVDSVAMAELTFELEKQFSIQIDDDILDVDTIRELTHYVLLRQKQ